MPLPLANCAIDGCWRGTAGGANSTLEGVVWTLFATANAFTPGAAPVAPSSAAAVSAGPDISQGKFGGNLTPY
jgi:hypothetical protein